MAKFEELTWVKHLAGGPPMLVLSIGPGGTQQVRCAWFDRTDVYHEEGIEARFLVSCQPPPGWQPPPAPASAST